MRSKKRIVFRKEKTKRKYLALLAANFVHYNSAFYGTSLRPLPLQKYRRTLTFELYSDVTFAMSTNHSGNGIAEMRRKPELHQIFTPIKRKRPKKWTNRLNETCPANCHMI